MKKKTLLGLISVSVLGIAVIGSSYLLSNKTGLSEASFRGADDIANDTVVYLDDEAIAASNSSDEDTELRSDALRAYNMVNEERAEVGEEPLTWDSNLESTAAVRAQEASQSFSHTRPNGTPWYTVNSQIMGGENLAWGQTSAGQVVDEWMASPTHRDNILYDGFSDVAISLYQSDSGTNYWALEFGY